MFDFAATIKRENW